MKPLEISSSPKTVKKRQRTWQCLVCRAPKAQVFRFPKEEKRRKRWLEFCELESEATVPESRLRLCSSHFGEDTVHVAPCSGRISLSCGALPTLLKPESNVLAEESARIKTAKYCLLCGAVPSNTSTFKFPNNETSRQQWLHFCKRETVRVHDKLCARHFSSADLKQNCHRPQLKLGAIPTLTVKLPRWNNTDEWAAVPSTVVASEVVPDADEARPDEDEAEPDADEARPDADIKSLINAQLSQILKRASDSAEVLAGTSDNTVPDSAAAEISPPSQPLACTPTTPSTRPSCHIGDITPDSADTVPASAEISSAPEPSACTPSTQSTRSLRRNITTDLANTVPDSATAEISTAPQPLTCTPTTRSTRPLRHIGDIRTPDLATPRRRKECLKIIRFNNTKLLKTNRNLKRSNIRLQARVRTLNNLISHLRKKSFISENASLHMQVTSSFW